MTRARKKPRTVITPRLRPHLSSCLGNLPRPVFQLALLGLFAFLLCPGRATSMWGLSAPGSKKGEKPYALIYGTIWGPAGQPVYRVKIKIRRTGEKKVRWELYSDHRGEFAQRVPAGQSDYVVGADLKGYKFDGGAPLKLEQEVEVHIENDERADIGLHLKR
jgi:hypothetical protein